jgi:tRNA G18 (ribose-2'-O)-methylase SpoU
VTEPVSDLDDPRLADYQRLTDPAFRIADEARRGFCIVESVEPLRIALGSVSSERIRSVLVTPEQHSALTDVLAPVADRVMVATRDVLRAIVGFDLHRGALASLDRVPLPTLDSVLANASLVAVCESLNDYENIGSLFRNAAAFGVDAVVLDPTCADPLYRRSIRVSIGHVFTVPWTRVEGWPATLDLLRHAGFEVAALTPTPGAVSIDEFATLPHGRVAVLLGAEGPGLSDSALAKSDIRVRIPMRRGVDSVNVATAAAITFHRLSAVR